MTPNPDGNAAASQVARKRRLLLYVALGAFALSLMFLVGALATSAWWNWALALGWAVMGVGYLGLRRIADNVSAASHR